MNEFFKSEYKPTTLVFRVKTFGNGSPMSLRFIVEDQKKPYTKYADRVVEKIKSGDEIRIKLPMPVTPMISRVLIYNPANGVLKPTISNGKEIESDKTFQVIQKSEEPVRSRLNVFDTKNYKLREFIRFATRFSEDCGILATNATYTSQSGTFRIDYVDAITGYVKDRQGKLQFTIFKTPCRINKEFGIIQVSKNFFKDYTVGQRLLILLHEYAHFYKNTDPSNEFQADANAILIFLGLGYSKYDAVNGFTKVFLPAPSDQNVSRQKEILHMIENFENAKPILIS